MPLHTCVSPEGRFLFGIHKPSYEVANQREGDFIEVLGHRQDGKSVSNQRNFPASKVNEEEAAWIYEIPNQFLFRGTTFIKKDWADKCAADPSSIKLPPQPEVSLSESLSKILNSNDPAKLALAFRKLPKPLLLAIATTSSDPEDLVKLARISCEFVDDKYGDPVGLIYESSSNDQSRPLILDQPLFEAVANNPNLPDRYKIIMVLKPGAQGGSEIVGEFITPDHSTHVFEYLRRNSYIAGGHYAANMADDAIRYSGKDLSRKDIRGLRHLYYQRTFSRMAEQLGLEPLKPRTCCSESELEVLRKKIVTRLNETPAPTLQFDATLWGWNYGFDFAPTQYRLHASHQQIHQQFAMLPSKIEDCDGRLQPTYGCGDLVADCTNRFHQETGCDFFESYLAAIRSNTRTDGKTTGPTSLIIHQDENVILFVPKAQTSQWELQLICLKKVGNIIEADATTRASIDLAILVAMKIFTALGGKMVTTIEFPKRLDSDNNDQLLLYSFLPKLPESPGAFSEAQLRWINGHYPEDFAEACRMTKDSIKY